MIQLFYTLSTSLTIVVFSEFINWTFKRYYKSETLMVFYIN